VRLGLLGRGGEASRGEGARACWWARDTGVDWDGGEAGLFLFYLFSFLFSLFCFCFLQFNSKLEHNPTNEKNSQQATSSIKRRMYSSMMQQSRVL
jgi:hypothetical protein